jgi:5-methylcytosine-specific restriction enzyme A
MGATTPSAIFTRVRTAVHNRKTEREKSRPGARQRGYSTLWDKASAAFLKEHPRCTRCGRPAEHVDHVIPHGGDARLFWNRGNWAALCRLCHSRKTAKRDGGFGNSKREVRP